MEMKIGRNGMFYGSLFVLVLLCVGLGSLLVFVALAQDSVDYGMWSFALVFFFLGVYTPISYIRKTPIVTMSDEGVRYTDKYYGWIQVTSVDFTTPKRFSFLWAGKYMKAVTLTFEDGNELHLFDDMYSGMRDVRSYIQSSMAIELHVQAVKEEELSEEETKKIKRKGNLFTVIVVAGCLINSIILTIIDAPKGVVILVCLLINVLFVFIFIKMFRRKKNEQEN